MNKSLPVKIILFTFIVFCLFLFFRTVEVSRITTALKQAGFTCFLFCMLCTAIAYWLACIAWKLCLNSYPKISLGKLFLVRHIGEVITLVNPASIVGGETAKVLLLKREGVSTKEATVSITASRIILIATQLLLFFVLVLILVSTGTQFPAAVSISISVFLLTIVTVLAFIYLLLKNRRVKTPSWILSSGRLQKIPVQMKEVYAELVVFWHERPDAVKWSAVYGMLHWILGGLEFYIILHFLGADVSVVDAVFIDMGVIFFKSAGAFIPGQLGIEELGNKILLEAVGIPGTEIWITASLLRRARQLCWLVLGIAAWLLVQRKQNRLTAEPNGNIVCKP